MLPTTLTAHSDGAQLKGPMDVRIVVDAAELFGSWPPGRSGRRRLWVTGDDSLAADLFAGIATLALD